MSSCSSCQKHQSHECGCHKKQGNNDDNFLRNSYYDHPWFRSTAICSCQKNKYHSYCDREY
jgi:hypothetical protein